MPNLEQLEILTRGADHWNRWRSGHPEALPDLSGANLSGVDLRGANLAAARLRQADLTGADLGVSVESHQDLLTVFGLPGPAPVSFRLTDLRDADLEGASLKSAILTATDLRNANLRQADLSLAVLGSYSLEPGVLSRRLIFPVNLEGAQLQGALLYRTTIQGAILRNALLDGALIAESRFLDLDLSGADRLEAARHFAPSTIDVTTLEQTAASLIGKQSEAVRSFFHNAGLPPEYLDAFLRRSQAERVSFYSCFISHSSVDALFCRCLCDRMRSDGLRVWYSPANLKGGRELHEQISAAIRAHDKLLLVLSEQSMNSNWVELEIREALEDERETGRRKLFPISLVDFGRIKSWRLIDADRGRDLAAEVRKYHILDFSSWQDDEKFDESYARLIQDLRCGEE
ncbi:MAG TPA: toll/interleukin-1 receptor domain-containing protein [Thermoanaerobaculia bacterium]|nr:toll/interleukin-1 receptor domain-containing protein [Thermoanaerobaculia bacterium]